MKRFVFLTFIIASTAWAAVDWDTEYEKVCETDAAFCGRLKESDGSWLKIKPEIVQLLKDSQVQKTIKDASAKYNVDPTAVAGAIAAENSLNVGVSDRVQTFLAKSMGITKVGSKSFSVGLGQINLPAAMEAENYIAKVENRAPRSPEEMTKEISDPEGSIRVAAQIVRKVQDDYKAQGIDVSDKPEVLATLYNLGKSEERAKRAKETGSVPKENYFGFFVKRYKSEIQDYTGISAVPSTVSGRAALPTKTKLTNPLLSVPSKDPVMKKTLRDVASKAMPLTSFPDTCSAQDYGQNTNSSVQSRQSAPAVGVLSKSQSYTVVSSKFGCDTTPWNLVRAEDGSEGWIKRETLEKNTEKGLAEISDCSSSPSDKKCQDNVEKLVAKDKIESADGLIYLKPKSGSEKPGFENEDTMCTAAAIKKRDAAKEKLKNTPVANAATPQKVKRNRVGASPFYGNYGQLPNTSSQEMAEEAAASRRVTDAVNETLEAMSAASGVPVTSLDNPQNPYANIYNTIAFKFNQIKQCVSTSETENQVCTPVKDQEKQLVSALKNLKFKKNPDLASMQAQTGQFVKEWMGGNTMYGGYANSPAKQSYFYAPTDDELANLKRETIVEALASCAERRDKFRKQHNIKTPDISQTGYGGGMNTGMGVMGSYTVAFDIKPLLERVRKFDKDEFEDHKSNLITMTKFCAARYNAIEGKPADNNPIVCLQAPKYINSTAAMANITHDLYSELAKSAPDQAASEIDGTLMTYAMQMQFNQQQGSMMIPIQGSESFPETNSYCPNLTAEYIENLLKENPCIKRVYTPSTWITKKLNNQNGKVLLREFEKSDRFAIELAGGGSCGK